MPEADSLFAGGPHPDKKLTSSLRRAVHLAGVASLTARARLGESVLIGLRDMLGGLDKFGGIVLAGSCNCKAAVMIATESHTGSSLLM